MDKSPELNSGSVLIALASGFCLFSNAADAGGGLIPVVLE